MAVCVAGTAIKVPEPLATHVRQLLARRSPNTRKARLTTDGRWLFPGADPGRPITQQGLSRRLRRHGVRPGEHRLASLHQLAAEVPAALLADLLGISPTTANAWARLSGGTWASYPEMRAAEGARR